MELEGEAVFVTKQPILLSDLTRSVSSKINSNPNITITNHLPSILQELNVGVLTEEFVLPLYPKVGFWTIRVVADGQASLDRNRICLMGSFRSFPRSPISPSCPLLFCFLIRDNNAWTVGGDIVINEKIQTKFSRVEFGQNY